MISITCLIGVFVWSSLDAFNGLADASGAAICVSSIAPAPIAAVNFLRLLDFIYFSAMERTGPSRPADAADTAHPGQRV